MSNASQSTQGTTHSTLVSAWVPMDIRALSQEADTIAMGVVTSAGQVGITDFKPIDRRITYTDYNFRVQQFLKNQNAYGHLTEISVRVLGGVQEELSIDAVDEPQFSEGEATLIFLSKDDGDFLALPNDGFIVLGGFQGKYSLSIQNGSLVTARPGEKPVSLNHLVDQIRDALL